MKLVRSVTLIALCAANLLVGSAEAFSFVGLRNGIATQAKNAWEFVPKNVDQAQLLTVIAASRGYNAGLTFAQNHKNALLFGGLVCAGAVTATAIKKFASAKNHKKAVVHNGFSCCKRCCFG